MSTALLLIDIQMDYFPGGRMELVGSTEAAGAAARLLAAFRRAAWPVYHVQHISEQPTASFLLPSTAGIADTPQCYTASRRACRHKAFPQQLPRY